MQLTNEQAETARMMGCRFVSATEAQVRQFSMQRRIFTIDGEPFLAARKDGFYETAGTLTALLAEALPRKEAVPPPPAEPAPMAEPPVGEPVAAAVPEAAEEMTEEASPPPPEPTKAALPTRAPVVAALPSTTELQGPVMAATVAIVKGYARRGTLDAGSLTALVSTVHQTLQRLR